MATTFKTFLNNDVTTTKTLLHEAIPITGAIVSGTYDQGQVNAPSVQTEYNIKNYSHGMFQSVYDYPYLSSSANHIFDIAVGYSTGSNLSGNISSATPALNYKQQKKKIAMYNQMAQVLMGHDKNGSIQRFDRDGNLSDDNAGKMDEVVFLNFSRLLVKDEIKKGSFQIKFGTQPIFKSGKGLQGYAPSDIHHLLTIKDTNAQNDFRINSPAGEYGILSASHTTPAGRQGIRHGLGSKETVSSNVGLIFYQAGVVVLTASIFAGSGKSGDGTAIGGGGLLNQAVSMSIGGAHAGATGTKHGVAGTVSASIDQMLTGSRIQDIANNIRRRTHDISFNNTTELNSTVYFCRANHNEFNYSANPSYLQSSKIRVKDVPSDMPISYVTSIGLYSPDNELMATAKLSEPLRKDPTNELTLRVRLDY
jgi:hypothetical protein